MIPAQSTAMLVTVQMKPLKFTNNIIHFSPNPTSTNSDANSSPLYRTTPTSIKSNIHNYYTSQQGPQIHDTKTSRTMPTRKKRRTLLTDSPNPLFQEEDDSGAASANLAESKAKAQTFAAEAASSASKGNFTAALQAYGRALALDATNAVMLEECAQVHLALGQYFDAIQMSHRAQATEEGRSNPYVLLTLGRAQLNFGELRMAQKSLQEALGLFTEAGKEEDAKEAKEDVTFVSKLLQRESEKGV